MSDIEETAGTLDEVVTPCLLVDMSVVRRNADRMRNTCEKLGVKLRANMKTHKTIEIAEVQTAGTKRCISVSTVREAEFYAQAGFGDIFYVSMFTHDKVPRVMRLANQLSSFHVMADNEYHIQLLESHPLNNKPWSVYLKVDCGNKRAGVVWDSERPLELVHKIAACKHVRFQGIYVHEGHAYNARGSEEAQKCGENVVDRMLALAQRIRDAGIECPEVTVGSTPSCNCPSPNMAQLTELHPGNYVFNDVMQVLIGSCKMEDIAVKVATRVKGHFPERNQLLVDAGFIAMSYEGYSVYSTELDGSFCKVENEPDLRLVKMCQEVGYVEACKGKLDYEKHPIGSLLYMLPYHSCATACQHPIFYAYEGNKITQVIRPCNGW